MMMGKIAAAVCCLALALCVAQLVSAHEEHMEVANKQVSLADVCANKVVPIISVKEARRIINDLKSNPSACSISYTSSFFELEPILTLDKNQLLCSESKFNQIAAYHFRYINPLVETYKLGDDLNNLGHKVVKRPLDENKIDYTVQLDDYKQEILIPQALQQFFKAWALQVSGHCKRSLVENLDKVVQVLTDADYNMIQEATKLYGKNPVTGADLSLEQLDFNNLVYMPRLEGEIHPGDIELRENPVHLDLRSKPEVNRFMHACQKRFKPIYSKLVLPIVRLAKLGYEYVGPRVDQIRDRLDKDETVLKWLAITLICEAPGNFELIENEDDKDDEGAQMEQLKYDPMYNYPIEGTLWIVGAEAVRKEFERLSGHHATGFKKFLYNTGIFGRKAVAVVDPHQFAWYRRNQNTLSSGLNIVSILSNGASILSSVLPG